MEEQKVVIQEEDKVGPIQRYYYEDMMTRRDTEVDRWHKAWKNTFIALVIMTALFIASWVGFIYYEKQFETVETWQEVWQEADGDGSNQFVGGDYNGWPAGQDENQDENP